MALATRIDALAAGVTLPVLEVHIAAAAAIIGGVTFALCLLELAEAIAEGAARRIHPKRVTRATGSGSDDQPGCI